jgi:mannose-6-phosphate isomerase
MNHTFLELYPLKFKSIFKEKIWGGKQLVDVLGKPFPKDKKIGESWEVSTVPGSVSMVSNGTLKGVYLQQLIEQYKEQLVGQRVFQKFQTNFPLLIKYLDAQDDLSVQVHPNDELAAKRYNGLGKSEMWYIMDATPNAQINVGFNCVLDKEKFNSTFSKGKLQSILNMEQVKKGDTFYLPAGRIHYIGKGILLAEIQQTSDITYRIYDFDRKDDEGNPRELHVAQAIEALDFTQLNDYHTRYELKENSAVQLVHSPYFVTDIVSISQSYSLHTSLKESFKIVMVVEGNGLLEYSTTKEEVSVGDVHLIPANNQNVAYKAGVDGLKIIEIQA